jgi:hypothetical protein
MFSKEAALAALCTAPTPGSAWIHAKTGNHYIVVRCAILESTLEPCVVYRSLKDGIEWIRTLESWRETVYIWGQASPRFYQDPDEMERKVACPACAGAGCSLVGQREYPSVTCDGSGAVSVEKAEAIRNSRPL